MPDDVELIVRRWKGGSDGKMYGRAQLGALALDDSIDSGTCRSPTLAVCAALMSMKEKADPKTG